MITPADTIAAVLLKMLEPVAPRWEADVIKRYEEEATNSFTHAKKMFAADNAKDWYMYWQKGMFINFPASTDYRPRGFEFYQACAADGRMTCDIEKARKWGHMEFERTRAAFIGRTSTKMAEAFGSSAKLRVAGSLAYGRMIEGVVDATDERGSMLSVHLSVITNYRYGENSQNGALTVYGQYPLRVRGVLVAGEKKDVVSIEEAAVLISGRNPAQEKRDRIKARQDAKKAWYEKVFSAQKTKEIYERLVSLYDFMELYVERKDSPTHHRAEIDKHCAHHKTPDPGSKKTAYAKVKEQREILKQLKAEKPR